MIYILIPYASKYLAGGGASTGQLLRKRRTAQRSLRSSTNRGWIAFTLAWNMISLIKEWSLICALNHRVSYLFCVYQIFLLTSTLIIIIIISSSSASASDTSSIRYIVTDKDHVHCSRPVSGTLWKTNITYVVADNYHIHCSRQV